MNETNISQVPVDVTLENGTQALQQEDWETAKAFFANMLQQDNRNVDANIGLCLAEYKQKTLNDLIRQESDFYNSENFMQAYKYADKQRRNEFDALHEAWLNLHPQCKRKSDRKIRRNATIAVVAVSVLLVCYFLIFPAVLNIVLNSGGADFVEMNDIVAMSPYKVSYTYVADGSYNVMDNSRKINTITIADTVDELIVLRWVMDQSVRTVNNKSDVDRLLVQVQASLDHYDILSSVDFKGFEDYATFIYDKGSTVEYSFINTDNTTDFSYSGVITEHNADSLAEMQSLHTLSLSDIGYSDLSFLKELKYLKNLSINGATSPAKILDALEHLPMLEELTLTNCNFTSFSLSDSFSGLKSLDVSNNGMASLDISALTSLTTLKADNNSFTSIDLSNNTALQDIYLDWHKMKECPDMSKMTDLNFDTVILPQVYVDELDITLLPRNIKGLIIAVEEMADVTTISSNFPELEFLTIIYSNYYFREPQGMGKFSNLDYFYIMTADDSTRKWIEYLDNIKMVNLNIEHTAVGKVIVSRRYDYLGRKYETEDYSPFETADEYYDYWKDLMSPQGFSSLFYESCGIDFSPYFRCMGY
ncbi:MAG: hypothetical protein E7478_00505 [Ruminococcaceae bacterium]|nr:hypothetical protein [Oscillospiraceae bacterium]